MAPTVSVGTRMNAPEHRKHNRRLGIILCLLFAGLFIIATTAIVTGSKAPPFLEKVVKGIGTPVLGVIGLLLVIAAVIEVVLRAVRNRARE